jgi:hypothetical protein
MAYNILRHRLVGATNIGSTDFSALTLSYSCNSLCWCVYSTDCVRYRVSQERVGGILVLNKRLAHSEPEVDLRVSPICISILHLSLVQVVYTLDKCFCDIFSSQRDCLCRKEPLGKGMHATSVPSPILLFCIYVCTVCSLEFCVRIQRFSVVLK